MLKLIFWTALVIQSSTCFALTFSTPAEEDIFQNIVSRFHPLVVSVNPLADITSNDPKRKANLNQVSASSGFIKSTSSSRVEQGDSGAPLFVQINNNWKILAVVKGLGSSGFSKWDAYTTADNKLCEFSNQIADPEIKRILCK